MPSYNLFTIDEAVVSTMVADNRFKTAFPCVGQAARKLSGIDAECSTCAKKQAAKPELQQAVFRQVLQCLGNMPTGEKKKLAAMLDTRQFRLVKKNAKGEPMVYTFRA